MYFLEKMLSKIKSNVNWIEFIKTDYWADLIWMKKRCGRKVKMENKPLFSKLWGKNGIFQFSYDEDLATLHNWELIKIVKNESDYAFERLCTTKGKSEPLWNHSAINPSVWIFQIPFDLKTWKFDILIDHDSLHI